MHVDVTLEGQTTHPFPDSHPTNSVLCVIGVFLQGCAEILGVTTCKKLQQPSEEKQNKKTLMGTFPVPRHSY